VPNDSSQTCGGTSAAAARTLHSLTSGQQHLLARWFGAFEIVTDLSWGLVDTAVLHVRCATGDAVVKAGGPGNHHIIREITAHQRWTGPWLTSGAVGRLLHSSADERMLCVEYLPGQLAQDTPEAGDVETYRQAGALLSTFHAQASTTDTDYEAAADAKAVAWLDSEHRIDAATEAQVRAAIQTHERPPATLVPTHGDWHTRNWLVHDGTIRVIDLGRADWRPALTDFVRLAEREWQGRSDLETAFFDGYGADPRDTAAWRATLLREAVGAAVWAYQVGDVPFEEQGHRRIHAALQRY
jgi:hypothetical protein